MRKRTIFSVAVVKQVEQNYFSIGNNNKIHPTSPNDRDGEEPVIFELQRQNWTVNPKNFSEQTSFFTVY